MSDAVYSIGVVAQHPDSTQMSVSVIGPFIGPYHALATMYELFEAATGANVPLEAREAADSMSEPQIGWEDKNTGIRWTLAVTPVRPMKEWASDEPFNS